VHNDGVALPAALQFPRVPRELSSKRDSEFWSPIPPGVFPHDYWNEAGLPWWNWGIWVTVAKIKRDAPVSDTQWGAAARLGPDTLNSASTAQVCADVCR